jgi:phosphatidylserine decarboxylase
MRFAREALPFVLPFALLAAVAVGLGRPRLAIAAALLALCVLLFFRIPTRRCQEGDPSAVLAPGNGVITRIDWAQDDDLGPEPYQRIVTFLSVFNVHVQRAPVAGRVIRSTYTRGRKVAAFRADAGEVNENHWIVIADADGRHFGVRQIAGLLARRVVSYSPHDTVLERGQLIGLIKFGSRVDLYLPPGYELRVQPGQKLVEGCTIVALPPQGGH